MKRSIALGMSAVILGGVFLLAVDAWARAGGGASSGSRGSRSYSAPMRSTPVESVRPAPPPSSAQPSSPQRSGWMGGLMGGLGGLLVGGLLGSLLFGGLGHGMFGGIGLMEIIVVGALIYFGLSFLRRRQQPTLAAPPGYASTGYVPGGASPSWRPEPAAPAAAVAEPPSAAEDLGRGLAHVRQMDAGFDPARFADQASDLFFRVQAAWTGRDMTAVRALLAPEMLETLQRDCDRLRAEGRVNHLENIAVRSVELTEAWQENGRDFVTVRFTASLLDYTTDESGARILDGSRTEPVKFEEFWTFVRPVGPGAWTLSAIQQPQ